MDAFMDFEETEESKIFPNEAFGYWKVTVERPLRLAGTDPGRVYKACGDQEPEGGEGEGRERRHCHQEGVASKRPRPDPIHGTFAVTLKGKPAVVEYEPDTDLQGHRAGAAAPPRGRRRGVPPGGGPALRAGRLVQPSGRERSGTRSTSTGTSTSLSPCGPWRRSGQTYWPWSGRRRACWRGFSDNQTTILLRVETERNLMNDSHVQALHYWVSHDDSVDYSGAEPQEYEDDLLYLIVRDGEVTIEPKNHYATEEEALAAIDGFLRHWEFEAAINSGSRRFSLTYAGPDIRDRNPDSPPPGIVPVRATVRLRPPTMRARVRVGRRKYPDIPTGPTLRLDDAVVQEMLIKIDRYHQGRETLPGMAYFCYTELAKGVVSITGNPGNKTKQVESHYSINSEVLRKVSELSSIGGGTQARKAVGASREFTKKEEEFLIAASKAFVRRAAERASNYGKPLPMITMADLPQL